MYQILKFFRQTNDNNIYYDSISIESEYFKKMIKHF